MLEHYRRLERMRELDGEVDFRARRRDELALVDQRLRETGFGERGPLGEARCAERPEDAAVGVEDAPVRIAERGGLRLGQRRRAAQLPRASRRPARGRGVRNEVRA